MDGRAAARIAGFGAAALATAALYTNLLTRGSFDLLGAEPFGLTYNSMLAHMLRGRWDVDPAVIGYEAFVHDGHSYAYFGPVPALLRLPLTLLPHWRTVHVERLSCLMAILIGIAAQVRAVLHALPRDAWSMAPILILASALGGPSLLLANSGALIYHEAILWAWTFATVFVALALDGVQRTNGPGVRHLVLMSLCAGCCLLTRSSTGAGLMLAVGLFLLGDLIRMRVGQSGIEFVSVWVRRSWSPVLLLGCFLAAAAFVNLERWHNPLVFADLRMQTILLQQFPDRLARLHRYGLFNLQRIWLGLAYYLTPIWVPRLDAMVPLDARISDLFDAAELPASSLFLTDPLWCVLAGFGIVLIVRRRVPGRALPLLAGLSLAPVLMLTAWYLAFRYRVEFAPLLLVLACIGLRGWSQPHRLARPAMLLLCMLQIAGTKAAAVAYARTDFGPSGGASAFDIFGAWGRLPAGSGR